MLVVQHQPEVPLGRFADWLGEHRILRPDLGEPLPESAEEPLVVLGGYQDAYADETWCWLPRLRALMAQAVERAVPQLGICLGAQLLTVATGGRVVVGDPAGLEFGVVDMAATDDAAADPLFSVLPRRWQGASSHGDGIRELGPDTVVLGSSALYTQAIRAGENAWGIQYHPEVTWETLTVWGEKDVPTLGRDGVDAALARASETWEDMTVTSRRLAERFAEIAQDWEAAHRRSAP